MTIDNIKQSTVGEIVSQNIAYAHVFKKYGIDFCCGGGISLSDACERNGIDINTIIPDLLNLKSSEKTIDFMSWSIDQLVDHIVNNHHAFVLRALPILDAYAKKVAKVHGNNYPNLEKIYLLVQELKIELINHMQKEEQVLFPYLQKLSSSTKNQLNESPKYTMSVLMEEHDHAGSIMAKIRILTNYFIPPNGACNTFKALYLLLEQFENDLHIHVHLENNILFQKAAEILSNDT